jgi:hypothetical protein
VGRGRLELPTSRLSGVCSNHLSYRPEGTEANPEHSGGLAPFGQMLEASDAKSGHSRSLKTESY